MSEIRLCVTCERIIDYAPTKAGRPPKYCSATCRAAANAGARGGR